MILRDVQIPVLRSASVAIEPCPRKEQNRDIQKEDACHADQDRDVRDISQNTDETQCKCEHDHDRCDLWKGLVFEEIFAATDDASSQLAAIIKAAFPVQKDFLIAVDRRRSSRLLVRIDLDLTQAAAVLLSYDDSHVVDGMWVREIQLA